MRLPQKYSLKTSLDNIITEGLLALGNDQRSDVVTGVFVVLYMRAITHWELHHTTAVVQTPVKVSSIWIEFH